MAALRSGHSHEDIDQVFGRLASFMQKRPFAQCPSDFVPLIQEFLNTGEFPYEDYREAFEVNRVRDWTLSQVQIIFVCWWFSRFQQIRY